MAQPSAFSLVFVPLSDIVVASTILATLALALRDAAIDKASQTRIKLAGAAVLAIWYGTVSVMAVRGIFRAEPETRFPALPVAVFLPIVLAAAILFRSRLAARVLDATKPSALIRIQILPVIGLVFLVEWAVGSLPGVFAFPAALGDIAVGLLAIPVARMAERGTSLSTAATLAWTALGLADFAVALATGFLSSAGPFQHLSLDQLNLLASAYPLALIPVFGVPLFALLHVLTVWKLARMGALRPYSRLPQAAGGAAGS